MPLSEEARRILLSVLRADSPFVFPGRGETSFDDWHRLKQEIDEAVGEPAPQKEVGATGMIR